MIDGWLFMVEEAGRCGGIVLEKIKSIQFILGGGMSIHRKYIK
jgi:hypothetical protein